MKLEIGSKEWLEARRKLITATDAAPIMGLSPWKTARQLYFDKMEARETVQNDAMKRGNDLEPEARRAFEQITGHFVNPEWITNYAFPWMGASMDGINDAGICCEIKCPGKADHDIAVSGKVPDKYYPQLQHQIVVAGVNDIYYFSYRPGDIQPCALIKVARDFDFVPGMMKMEKEFWDNMQLGIPPEPTAKDLVKREDRTWLMLEEELSHLITQSKAIEERKENLKRKLIDLCGEKPSVGYRIKMIPVHTKGHIDYSSVPELQNVNLEAYRKPAMIRWRMDQI